MSRFLLCLGCAGVMWGFLAVTGGALRASDDPASESRDTRPSPPPVRSGTREARRIFLIAQKKRPLRKQSRRPEPGPAASSDATPSPTDSTVATPELSHKSAMAKMTPEQRDKHVEAVGLERWKLASPKTTPEVTSSKDFLLFGNLPRSRATNTLKVVENEYLALWSLLAQAGGHVPDWGEKTSLYVFNDPDSLSDFIRKVEGRAPEPGDVGTARFNQPEPYVAVVDPLGGREESSVPRRPIRAKRGRDEEKETVGPERSLAGVLTEHLAIGMLAEAGDPPQWLTLGLGAYLASRIDAQTAYAQKLRQEAFDQFEAGWVNKANDALAGRTKAEEVRPVGFAIIDWAWNEARPLLPAFVHGMLKGGEEIDNVLTAVFEGTREQFLGATGEWVGSRYGRTR